MPHKKPKGWVKEPGRHGMAARGIKTAVPGRKQPVPSGFEIDERAEDYMEQVADDIEEVLNDRGFDPYGFEGEEALGDAIQQEAGDRVFEPLLQAIAQNEGLDPDADEEQITDISASAFQKAVYVVAKAMWADMEREPPEDIGGGPTPGPGYRPYSDEGETEGRRGLGGGPKRVRK